MFIKETFIIRHKLLKVLHQYDLKFYPSIDLNSITVKFDEIHKQLPQYSKLLLLDNLDYLSSIKEIYCSRNFDNSVFHIYSAGNHAYRTKKYIREGIKEEFNFVYDIAKTISVIALLFIAVWTFIQNISQTKQNKLEIQQLKQEIQDLNNNLQQVTQSKK